MKLIGPVEYRGKWGFLSPSGDWAIEPRFDQIGEFREGLAGFCDNGKLGFLDEHANIVIEPRFKIEYTCTIWGFREGLAPVQGECTAYIDRCGDVAIRLPSDALAWHFIEGRALSLDSKGYGVLDTNGNILSRLPIYEAPFVPNWPGDWRCFNCWFWNEGMTAGALDWQGHILFEPKYADLGDFYEGGCTLFA